MGNRLTNFLGILRDAGKLFSKNDPLRMAGATAFFTMFALPPILIILAQVFSLFINPQTIQDELTIGLSETFGKEAVRLIITVIQAFTNMAHNWLATIFGFLFLTFVATTLFKVIKNSINQLWDLPLQANKKVMSTIRSRLRSMLVLLITGFLFTIAVFIETLQVFIGNYIFKIFPSMSSFFNQFQAFTISTLIIAAWLLMIFRFLPSGRPSWRIAWVGALFTSFLFSIGKIILHVLLSYNNITSIYGASASIVLLLLFLFYSALILYYGAAFTKNWAIYKQEDILVFHNHSIKGEVAAEA
ncbi:MAG TPA: YihY/virulence factor BrkB family protein [Ferruginibacter sp.]|nr:YihY/virulence factor BrkB family protein [Ferruginibacter sp.]